MIIGASKPSAARHALSSQATRGADVDIGGIDVNVPAPSAFLEQDGCRGSRRSVACTDTRRPGRVGQAFDPAREHSQRPTCARSRGDPRLVRCSARRAGLQQQRCCRSTRGQCSTKYHARRRLDAHRRHQGDSSSTLVASSWKEANSSGFLPSRHVPAARPGQGRRQSHVVRLDVAQRSRVALGAAAGRSTSPQKFADMLDAASAKSMHDQRPGSGRQVFSSSRYRVISELEP